METRVQGGGFIKEVRVSYRGEGGFIKEVRVFRI
jgi:hypothetical protein